MDRSRRNQPEDRSKTSQLIQQIAAQRERKLQQSNSTSQSSTGEVFAASSVPLPGSFDEEDDFDSQAPIETQTAPSKARSRLVRRDHIDQHAAATAPVAADDDVDDLASLLQGVDISSRTTQQQPQQQSASGRATTQGGFTTHSSEPDPIEEDSLGDDSDSDSTAGRPVVVPRRKPAATAAATSSRPRAATGSEEAEEGDTASIDSADSDSGGPTGSSSGHCADDAAAAAAAQPFVLDGGFRMDGPVANKLYPHQVHGVKWLWSLHSMGKGGILADDMGLGKTMQCSAFLAGALAASRSSSSSIFNPKQAAPAPAAGSQSAAPVPVRALIVAPKTLLAHWEKELRVCGMGRATHSFYSSSEGERSSVLTTITRRGGIMLTTYGMVLHNASQIMSGKGTAVARDIDEHEDEEDLLCPEPPQGRRILWDYIILDEGHKIKNARTQLAQRLREIRARVRIIISGTPVQNNLGELHALMEFAVPGLLGSAKDFKAAFEKPINAGQDRSATLRVRELGAARAAELRQLVAPYILRREKKEVLGDGTSNSTSSSTAGTAGTTNQPSSSTSTSGSAHVVAAACVGPTAGSNGTGLQSGSASGASKAAAAPAGGAAGPAPMGKKTDLVVWLKLTALQRHIYEAFLHSDAVKAALNSSKSPLAALTVLKKVCDHPALLSERATKLVVTAASKPSRSAKGQSGSSGSKAGKYGGKVKRRNSLNDFIVGDSDSEDGSEGSSCDEEEDISGSDNEGSAGLSRQAAARAAVAASLDTFSEEFLSWASAGGGEDLEKKLLADVGARGTESSCKSLFVAALLDELVAAGHRTLVFSQSRVMLDILQAAVKARGWNFCRIDGSMARAEARQAEVERFQTAPGGLRGIPVFLLTTQVGGLGLTLTAADRVVIVDPSWNPATDNQSVDRAYRIGQSRDVVVYRLVTCGTVEEKIYRKQVFKGGLSKAGMEEGIQLRYFTHQELHELFKWDPDALNASETQQLLKQQHAQQLRQLQQQQSQKLTAHVCWVEDNPLCAGTSQHGLLFSLEDPEGKQLNISAAGLAAGQDGGSGSGARRFQDSGGQPRKGNGGSSSSQGRFRGPEGGADGGSGSSSMQPSAAALDEMMQSLHIGNGSSSSRSGLPAGASAHSSGPDVQQQKVQELLKRIKQLQSQLHSAKCDLQQLGPRLPDGGAKIAARRDSLQTSLDEAQAELQQLDPQAAAAAASAAGPGGSRAAGQSATSAAGYGSRAGVPEPHQPLLPSVPLPQQQQQQYPPINPFGTGPGQPQPPPHQHQPQWQRQQQQPHANGDSWGRSQPQYNQQQWQQQQQGHWPDQLPPPPPPPPLSRPQQQVGPGVPRPQQQPPGQQHPAAAAAAAARSGGGSAARPGQPPARPGVQTLDGRVPTVDELRQRKHVLKKALQHEDKLKAQLQEQGREYPADKQQRWRQMYVEYKEIKQVLQAVEEAEAAERVVPAGRNHRQQQDGVIDLT